MNKGFLNMVTYGDSEEELKNIESNSVDLCACDPQYGYSFLNLDWDKALPKLEILKEINRVLKPGAFGFFMAAPRQDVLSRMILKLEETGFDINFTSIYWTYASGFPKSQNVSKSIDKMKGLKQERGELKKLNPRDKKSYLPNTFDSNLRGFQKNPDMCYYTIPISTEAKKFEGAFSGFQPKPAIEVIIVAMKPIIEKTYMAQALSNGKGVTWFDECRIPYINEIDEKHQADIQRGQETAENGTMFGGERKSISSNNLKGRFPANLLVCDDVLNNGIVTKATTDKKDYSGPSTSTFVGNRSNRIQRGDSGSYSRYFDLDKWFEDRFDELPEEVQTVFPFLIVPKPAKSEKNKGCERIINEKYTAGNYSQSPVCKDCGLTLNGTNNHDECSGEVVYRETKSKIIGNNHPTVKPLKLFSYLITLGSREGDVILDPFLGSGTTAIAAKMLNRNFIGIEKNKSSVTIAEARLEVLNEAQLKLAI